MHTLPRAVLFFSAFIACAQEKVPVFEVASVKLNPSGPDAPNGFSPTPGRLRVKTGLLFGMTAWMKSDRFDIDAKAAGNSDLDEDMAMLRSLLVDRFQLRFHHETRRLKTYALVLGKGGAKFQASTDRGRKEAVNIGATEISGVAIPFGHFVSVLGAQLGYPITDRTGLSGRYDLTLKYVRDDSSVGPSVFAALKDLGLNLETRTGPIEVFVIDSAERPHEN